MVVPLEEDGDLVFDHELVDRQFPAGPVTAQAPGIAPFVGGCEFCAAAPGSVDVMREDKFIFRRTLFERLLQPAVLFIAEPDIPQVALLFAAAEIIVDRLFGVPVGIEGDEQGVAPRPGIIVAQQADVRHFVGVAAVKPVRRRLRKEPVAAVLRPDRDVIGASVEIGARGLLVIAVDQKQRGGMRDQPEIRQLPEVNLPDGFRVHRLQRIHAEIVAHADVEVRAVLGGGQQHLLIQRRVVLLRAPLRMRVALDLEHKRTARSAGGMKSVRRPRLELGVARLAVAQPVGDLRIRRQIRQRQLCRRFRRQQLRRGAVCAVFNVAFQLRGRINTQADPVRFRNAEDDRRDIPRLLGCGIGHPVAAALSALRLFLLRRFFSPATEGRQQHRTRPNPLLHHFFPPLRGDSL